MNENAEKWVAALESGEYEQAKNVLHRKTEDGDSFCCLGVACDVAIKNGLTVDVEEGEDREGGFVRYNGIGHFLPSEVASWLGVRTNAGYYRKPNSHSGDDLASHNDKGDSFADIAKIIRSEPKDLFDE